MTTQSTRKTATKAANSAAKATATRTQAAAKKRPASLAPSSPPASSMNAASALTARRPQRGKLAQITTLLERENGANLIDLMAATGWQAHSVRGALSTLKKKLDRPLHSTLDGDGLRQYRLESK